MIDLKHLRADPDRFRQGARDKNIDVDSEGGAELFVLDGSFEEAGETIRRHSWLRVPIDQPIRAKSGPDGARVWIKSGHLRFAGPPSSA